MSTQNNQNQTDTYIDTENQKDFLIKLTMAVTKKDIDEIPLEELEKTILNSYNYMLDWMINSATQNNDSVFAKEIVEMKEGKKSESLHPESFNKKFEKYYLEFLESLEKEDSNAS
jgi:hypothetical protein